MPTLDTLLLFAATEFVMCLSPGPVVATIISQGLSGSKRGTLGAMLGINLGNLFWYVLVAIGLGALYRTMPGMFQVLRWIGIGYLLFLGISTLAKNRGRFFAKADDRRKTFRGGFTTGLAIHMANPKALLFYAVIVPPFIDATRPAVPQVATLAVATLIIEWITMGLYALVSLRLARSELPGHVVRIIDRVSGVCLLIAAALLAFWL